MFRNHWLIALTAIAVALVQVIADAHARAGGGFSGGSRGMRTFSAPPTIPTAPTAAPIQNSMTQPGSAAPIGQTAIRPGLFGGGLFGGSAAGFLGAGLFGLLFGQGFFGGMVGFASIIGLPLQVMLVVIVARLIFAWWQRRNMPAPAYAAAQPATGHRPVRALPARVPLGPHPWLRRLRCRLPGFVRRLLSYYGGVRLLTIVHHRLRLLASPMRTSAARVRSLLVDRETSRFPCKERPHMPSSPTTPGRASTSVDAPVRVAFRNAKSVGARNEVIFAAQ